jgi:hypothetical protein
MKWLFFTFKDLILLSVTDEIVEIVGETDIRKLCTLAF